MEQLSYNLLFRWFVGLSMDESVWVPRRCTARTATGCWKARLPRSSSPRCWARRGQPTCSRNSGVYQVEDLGNPPIARRHYRSIFAADSLSVYDLRPARETCEKRHWPNRFAGDIFLVRTHYGDDEQNTPATTVALTGC